jgi:acyl transferase domain-containing protein
MATDKEFLASRIAYKLNCCGPAVNVQAACATSMFGIQAAIQALLLRECDAALVGAAAVSVPQSIPYYFEPGMPFSADGHCRPFDIKASGTVFGSGAAVVGLKRLGDALADGDQIHAVIRSVATNNDGAHRAGMSAPSVAGQARVIREALDIAGVGPEQISYVEAHGTATPIGDPIEIKALANAFADRDREHTCYLGSVKGNIGHLGWAAGMAGLIKATLITRHKVIPPTINFEQYNPQLYIEETPFTVNRQQVILTTPHVIVGVSSFGLGGNNSHLIVETAPAPKVASSSLDHERLCLIPISARERDGLQQLCASYRQFLEAQTDGSFPLFVANLLHSRSLFEQRTYVIVNHRREAIDALAGLTFDACPPVATAPRVGLMFSGQGGEHRDMGRELYTHEALFKAELDAFDPVCQDVFGASAANLLFDPLINGKIEEDIARSQPMTFALQVAMARLFLSSGIGPVALFGHSLGEYAAACVAGVFTAEQGFRMLVQRSRLLDSLGDIGAMVVLGAITSARRD